MSRRIQFCETSAWGMAIQQFVGQYVLPALAGFVFVGCAVSGESLFAQQQVPSQQKQPLEYIESSSPAAGGGVVTSVYVPGRGAPIYNRQSETSMRQYNSPTRLASAGTAQGQSVLTPVTARNPAANPNLQGVAGNPGFVTSSGLGVPVNWNRSLRPNCAGCETTGVQPGMIPQPPQSLPNAASFPPTLTSVGRPNAVLNQVPQLPQGQSTYKSVFNRRAFPANTYAGQGIFGSPKLYVSNQPVRNFFRYIIIP